MASVVPIEGECPRVAVGLILLDAVCCRIEFEIAAFGFSCGECAFNQGDGVLGNCEARKVEGLVEVDFRVLDADCEYLFLLLSVGGLPRDRKKLFKRRANDTNRSGPSCTFSGRILFGRDLSRAAPIICRGLQQLFVVRHYKSFPIESTFPVEEGDIVPWHVACFTSSGD